MDLPTITPPKAVSSRQQQTLLSLVLVALVGLTFYPALNCSFIYFDDPDYVLTNTHVQSGLGWSNLVWAFSHTAAANWHPLTWISHMLDCQIFGLNPRGHHFTSVLLHAFKTVLAFLVFKRLTGAIWKSF